MLHIRSLNWFQNSQIHFGKIHSDLRLNFQLAWGWIFSQILPLLLKTQVSLSSSKYLLLPKKEIEITKHYNAYVVFTEQSWHYILSSAYKPRTSGTWFNKSIWFNDHIFLLLVFLFYVFDFTTPNKENMFYCLKTNFIWKTVCSRENCFCFYLV